LDVGTNVDIDQVNTQNRVSQASPNLPTSVNQYGVTVKKLMGLPLLVLSVYSPKETYADNFWETTQPSISTTRSYAFLVSGQVTNFGAADYAMRIWIKPDQLTKLGLTVSDLSNACPTAECCKSSRTDRCRARSQGPAVYLRSSRPRKAGRCRGIWKNHCSAKSRWLNGQIEKTSHGSNWDHLFISKSDDTTGSPQSSLLFIKPPVPNALAVAKQVQEQMEDLKTRFPQDLDYTVSMDPRSLSRRE